MWIFTLGILTLNLLLPETSQTKLTSCSCSEFFIGNRLEHLSCNFQSAITYRATWAYTAELDLPYPMSACFWFPILPKSHLFPSRHHDNVVMAAPCPHLKQGCQAIPQRGLPPQTATFEWLCGSMFDGFKGILVVLCCTC